MSACYIFSAMGFYPINPVSVIYMFGSPLLKNTTIRLAYGKVFIIHVKNAAKTYIRSVLFNGISYNKLFIRHDDIERGGSMEFTKLIGPIHSLEQKINSYP